MQNSSINHPFNTNFIVLNAEFINFNTNRYLKVEVGHETGDAFIDCDLLEQVHLLGIGVLMEKKKKWGVSAKSRWKREN